MGWWLLLLPAHAGDRAADDAGEGTAVEAAVDRVMVDVAGEILLASDLARDQALQAHDPLASPFWSEGWGSSAERLTDAAAIRLVAAAVGIYTPSADVVRDRVRAHRASFVDDDAFQAFLDRFGWTEGDVAEVLRGRALVDRYLARNLQSDPADVDTWLAEARKHVALLRARLRIRQVRPIPAPTP